VVAYSARKYLTQPTAFRYLGTHVVISSLGWLNRFVTGIYSRELLLFLIASVFVLGEFCESVFYFVFRTGGVVNFSELFGRGHSFEQEVYLFDLPGAFTSWTDGVPFGG
jgi:hypothetical protein